MYSLRENEIQQEGSAIVAREWVCEDVSANRYRFSDIHDDSTQMTQRKAG